MTADLNSLADWLACGVDTAMAFSSVSVVSNALLLRRWRMRQECFVRG